MYLAPQWQETTILPSGGKQTRIIKLTPLTKGAIMLDRDEVELEPPYGSASGGGA